MPAFSPIQKKLPKSRITLTYRTVIDGTLREVELPFRFLVLGQLSPRRPDEEPARDLSTQHTYPLSKDNFDSTMAAINRDRPLMFTVNQSGAPSYLHQQDGAAQSADSSSVTQKLIKHESHPISVRLELTELKSLYPSTVAKNVPFVRDLIFLRSDLLGGLLAAINNDAKLYTALTAIYKDAAKLKAVVDALGKTAFSRYLDPSVPLGPEEKAWDDAVKDLSAKKSDFALKDAAAKSAATTAARTGDPADQKAAADAKAAATTAKAAVDAAQQAVDDKKKALAVSIPELAAPLALLLNEDGFDATAAATAKINLLPLFAPYAHDPKDIPKGATPTETANNKKAAQQALALAQLAALFLFIDADPNATTYPLSKKRLIEFIAALEETISFALSQIIHAEEFKKLESVWRALSWMVDNIDLTKNITIDILDAKKEDIADDFGRHTSNIFNGYNGALHKMVYVQEFDQYGGRPFGAMIGLYDFDSRPDDLDWLRSVANLANAAHAPFIASAKPSFFKPGSAITAEEIVNQPVLKIDGPEFNEYNALRADAAAAYVGLTFPKFILRVPFDPVNNPCRGLAYFREDMNHEDATSVIGRNSSSYLWGSSAVLMACNLARSFAETRWCQYIRGHNGGGLVDKLPADQYTLPGQTDDQKELQIPVEAVIPDFRELEFSKAGTIPLVYRKYTSDATFFSVSSLKDVPDFEDPKDRENAQMVSNLAYTFSVTRIAHYFKQLMRHQVGNTADESSVHKMLDGWLNGYVTTVTNPDDNTLRRYPFRAAKVEVRRVPGQVGWFDCKAAILPHSQFEGLDIELRLEARLEAGKN